MASTLSRMLKLCVVMQGICLPQTREVRRARLKNGRFHIFEDGGLSQLRRSSSQLRIEFSRYFTDIKPITGHPLSRFRSERFSFFQGAEVFLVSPHNIRSE